MEELIEFYGKPKAIRIDNRRGMTSARFINWAERHGIEPCYVKLGKPNQNAFVELLGIGRNLTGESQTLEHIGGGSKTRHRVVNHSNHVRTPLL